MFCIKDLYLTKKIITTVSDAGYGFGNSECSLHYKLSSIWIFLNPDPYLNSRC